MIRKAPCILLLMAILLGIISLSSCAQKTPYEKLIELRESYYDTNGEWSALYSKYPNPIDKKKREEITKERNAKEKKLREELGLYADGTLQEFKEKCKLTEEDIKRYIDTYSFADFYILGLGHSDNMILWLIEIYPEDFAVFDFNNKPETTAGSYYFDNSDPFPMNRTIPVSDDGKVVNTYTVTYHGDFAIEYATVHRYTEGMLGWHNGVFYDTPGGYISYDEVNLYYKGNSIRGLKSYHPSFTVTNYDNTNSLFYVYTFETPSVIEKNGLNTYSGIYIWYDDDDMNRNPWGIIKND